MRWQGTRGSAAVALALCGVVAGCGGGDASPARAETGAARARASGQAIAPQATTQADAVRLAHQATFGPTEALVAEIAAKGAATWISEQIALGGADLSRYTSGGDDALHIGRTGKDYCARPEQLARMTQTYCFREYESGEPLARDFFRNAVRKPDQLRQRVALALQQILVISGAEVQGTYGMRNYHNMLLAAAFGNYRDLLRAVTLSPVMGDYLDHVNNDPVEPNENFGRELLQLFSIGPCMLTSSGGLVGGKCTPSYDNTTVRNYAYALTGWTYPAGGSADWCRVPSPDGTNCQYYGREMVAVASRHDTTARPLLSGVEVPANSTPAVALERVLDSVMNHQNVAPFVALRLIRQLVASNPSSKYVGRVAAAFTAGRYTSGGVTFGAGLRGDLAATVAAVLLDAEARGAAPRAESGFLRQPALLFAGALRAFNGRTDGARLGQFWGGKVQQQMFRPPTVFNFFPPDFPVSGTSLLGPEFGILNASTHFERLNYLTMLFDRGGIAYDPASCTPVPTPEACIPDGTGTAVSPTAFRTSAADPAALVDRIALMLLGEALPEPQRQAVIDAVAWWNVDRAPTDWRDKRISAAAYLLLASPDVQTQR